METLNHPSLVAKSLMASSVVLLALSADLSAAVLASYTFPTKNAAGFQSSQTASYMNAGALTANGTFNIFSIQSMAEYGGTTEPYASAPVLRMSAKDSSSGTLAGALTQGSYFSITLTPSELTSFTSLTFNLSKGGSSGTRGFALFSDAAGFNLANATSFTSTDALAYSANLSTVRTFTDPASFFNVDLSTNPGFQNVIDPVTFYFYVFVDSTSSTIEFDNITFNGVPEPTTSLLAASGLALAALRRKRAV